MRRALAALSIFESCIEAVETARRYRPLSRSQAFFGTLMRDFPLALHGTPRRSNP
jgi:hypothetical protein